MNETIQVLMNRKSIRVFEDKEISPEIKDIILAAAMRAPTGGNCMPYSIIDVTDQSIKDKLAETCDHQPFIAQAKMVLIFCADYHRWYRKFKMAGCEDIPAPELSNMVLATEDAVIAAHTACIAAESLGIGSCYIGDIMENCEEQRRLLCLPDYVFPAAMLVFGWPTEQQKQRPKPERCEQKHIVHENTYRDMDGEELREMFAYKCKNRTYEEWCNAFCNRKYNSDFSKEMSRSVEKYLEQFGL